MYRWLKDESYAPPVTFLSRPDGTATANVGTLLQDAWRSITASLQQMPSRIPRPSSAVLGTVSGRSP